MNFDTATSYESSTAAQWIEKPITATFEVELADSYAPVFIYLNQLFGGFGFTFTVAAEEYRIVDVDGISQHGLMFFSTCPDAVEQRSTRIIVRGVRANCEAYMTMLNVRTVSIEALKEVV